MAALAGFRTVLILLVTSSMVSLSMGQGRAALLEADNTTLVVEYRPSVHRAERVGLDSATVFFYPASELTGIKRDKAPLPAEVFIVGIPPTGDVSLEVLGEEFGETISGPVAAASQIIVSDDSLQKVSRIYEQKNYRQEPPARVAEIRWFRYQRIAIIEVQPYRYDRQTEGLTRITLLTVRLRFSGAFEAAQSAPPDPHFEETYSSLLINYHQSRAWRSVSPVTPREAVIDPTGQWFDPLREYLKVTAVDDGIVRMTYEGLSAVGALPFGTLSSQISMISKGIQIPLHVSDGGDGVFGPGDMLEFYGTALRDSALVRNEFSDTSAFWFLFNEPSGLRSASDTLVVPIPDDTVESYSVTVRMETDSFYFFGNGGLLTNNQSAKAPGEGWYWKRILANQTATIPFTARHFWNAGTPSFEIRGRLHSPVSNTATPNHEVEVRLNNVLLGVVQFDGSKDTIFTLSGPASLFPEGLNTVSVHSNPTGATVNDIYVDWIELTTKRELIADEDTLFFNGNEVPAGQTALFQLQGFSSPDISVYRIGPGGGVEKTFRGELGGTGPYSIVFTDTITPGRDYVALSESRKRNPLSMERKVFANLRSASLGADYLIITTAELSPEASRLASYRSKQGLGRTRIVLTQDIYDEFSYGHFDPFALRWFLLGIDTLWTAPAPAYVVFFGDASWDYKDNLKGGRRNLVPSLGNPVSDSWLVAAPDDVFLQTKKTGRIPARSVSEAAAFVDMLIAYEAQPLTDWNKRFLFLTSGFDSVETARFSNFSETLISQRIVPSPISGKAERLYKTSAVVEFEQTEEVKSVLRNGAVWMNFYGHAGTDFWGNGLSMAEQFVNHEGKRHLISDISCSTVRFAEPLVESFSERLLFADAGGVVAYLGSSGFGFETPLQVIARELYKGFAVDTVRDLGSLLLNAKIVLRGVGQPSLITQFSLQQMTLLGDPATRLRVGVSPDLALRQGEIATNPAQPTEAAEEVSIVIPIRNYGLHSQDSILIRLVHSVQGESPEIVEVLRPPIGRLDTTHISRPSFKKGGLHSLTVLVDPLNTIAEESETNNEIALTYVVGSGQVITLYPLSSSTSEPSATTLVVQNPGISTSVGWLVRFEIDSSSTFKSNAKVSNVMPQGTVVTSWLIPPGNLAPDAHYYWRARVENGSDSSEWAIGEFVTSLGTPRQWIQDRQSLFEANIHGQTEVASGVRLQSRNKELMVISAGFDDGNDAVIWIDSVNISQGFSGRGYNVAVLNQFSGETEFFWAFSIYSDSPDTSLAEPLIQFLNGIPDGRKVIIGIADEGRVNQTERLIQALESLGSGQIRFLTFRGSWAIIGAKGAAIGSVPEGRSIAGAGPVTLVDTVLFESRQGTVSTGQIGPARSWSDVFIDIDTSGTGTHASLDVSRFHRRGFADTVRAVNMMRDSILAVLHDSVRTVRLHLNLSSEVGGQSPKLNQWWMVFERPPELTSNYQAGRLNADTVLEGTVLGIEADIYNVSQSVAESVKVAIYASGTNGTVPLSEVVLPAIEGGAFETIQTVLPTEGMKGRLDVVIHIDPEEQQVETFTGNNVFSLSAIVLSDTSSPDFVVTFDGVHVFDNDYVRPEPEIRILIRDNSPLPITDPNSVVLKLNNRRITLGSSPDSLFETLTGAEKAGVTFRPSLAKGEHILSVQVLDASGNPADTMEYEIRFKVETDLRLLNVFNFPNPFSSETAFTFHLTGLGTPEEVSLRVYTTSGRLIYERRLMPGEVNVGFNRIPWDGRDQNGDAIANGVYFYKVSAVQNGKRVEVVEKMARVR